MGITDTLENIGEELIAANTIKLAEWIAGKVLGHKADDSDREAIARAVLAAAAAAAEDRAKNKIAAEHLEEALRELAAASAKILDAFKPTGSMGTLLDASNTEIIATVTPATWAAMGLAMRVDPPLPDDPHWVIGRVDGHGFTLGDGNRDLPPTVEAWNSTR